MKDDENLGKGKGGKDGICRTTLYVPRKMMEWVKSHYGEVHARNVNEFVVMALEFFAGYVTAENAEEYLIKTIASMMDAKLGISGDRMEGMLFKVAVEVAMQNRILANAIRVDESRVEEIREKAVDDVRRIWR